jgi:hypothetical protein
MLEYVGEIAGMESVTIIHGLLERSARPASIAGAAGLMPQPYLARA